MRDLMKLESRAYEFNNAGFSNSNATQSPTFNCLIYAYFSRLIPVPLMYDNPR
jgi:hypothetical protein